MGSIWRKLAPCALVVLALVPVAAWATSSIPPRSALGQALTRLRTQAGFGTATEFAKAVHVPSAAILDAEGNGSLSIRHENAIVQALVKRGIPADHPAVVAFRHAASQHREAGRQPKAVSPALLLPSIPSVSLREIAGIRPLFPKNLGEFQACAQALRGNLQHAHGAQKSSIEGYLGQAERNLDEAAAIIRGNPELQALQDPWTQQGTLGASTIEQIQQVYSLVTAAARRLEDARKVYLAKPEK